MVRLALCSALSDRAADDKVVVVDDWGFDGPKTKDALALLEALEIDGKILLVLGEDDEVVWRSFRNLADVHCLFARELNAYDVLVADYVVFSRQTLPGAEPAPAPSETPVDVDVDTSDDAENDETEATDGDADA
jgi:large subunit ribosomal protein L4